MTEFLPAAIFTLGVFAWLLDWLREKRKVFVVQEPTELFSSTPHAHAFMVWNSDNSPTNDPIAILAGHLRGRVVDGCVPMEYRVQERLGEHQWKVQVDYAPQRSI